MKTEKKKENKMSDISKVVFERLEDGIVTFEIMDEETTVDYPEVFVPIEYKDGDIIKVKLHKSESGEIEFIEFIEIDEEAMAKIQAEMMERSRRMKARILNNQKKQQILSCLKFKVAFFMSYTIVKKCEYDKIIKNKFKLQIEGKKMYGLIGDIKKYNLNIIQNG